MRASAAQLSLGLACAAAACGGAGQVDIRQFAVPVPAQTSRVEPQPIAAAPDGSLWFTVSWLTFDDRLRGVVAHVDSAGTVTLFDRPEMQDAVGIAVGADGNIWFTDLPGLARMTPSGEVTKLGLPPSGGLPIRVAAAPDGGVWFTEDKDRIGHLHADGTFEERSLPHQNSGLQGIAVSNGAVWFVEAGLNAIGRIGADGAIAEFPIPTPVSGAQDIAAAPDGTVWFSESQAGKLGHVNDDGSIDEHSLSNATPFGLATDSAGDVWFADLSGRLGKVAATTGDVSQFELPPGSSPNWVAVDAAGNVWVSEAGTGSLAKLSR